MHQKILVTKPFLPPKEEFLHYVDKIWENEWLTNQGPLHEEFINQLKTYMGVEYITPTVNGHLALEIALKGLGISGEVITTPFTFASTTHALSLCGIRPVFCDIREEDLTINAKRIEELITEKTSAILPVHVYGHICDVEEIDRIAEKYNLKVIYDAAHAFGMKWKGTSVGSLGDVSMFSFHATKLFNTIEGGALIYKNKEYEKIFNAYKNFGIENEESVTFIGGNAKMNEFQAAMGLANLNHMNEIIEDRKASTLLYRELLSDIEGIHYFVTENTDIEYNYGYLPIIINMEEFGITRDALHLALKEYQIFTRKYFYPVVPDYECYRNNCGTPNIPVARMAGRRILTLPLYYGMGKETIEYICQCIKNVSSNK